MKKNKMFGIALFILAFSVFCTSVMSTISKYVTKIDVYFGDDKKIDYTVSSVFEVKTQDELFAAINQGYSYIQISKDVENPLIVTKAAENLDADLILDLNGIEIQRNGSDPILNVGKGVRLTVTDTSTEQTGGLYNPIGSVFNINDGGILTVVTGLFESGPRYSEYYSYNTKILENNNVTKRTVVEANGEEVNFYRNGQLENSSYVAPIIKSYPIATGDVVYNHGNLYFDEAVTKGSHTIPADTYCYYRTSEDSVVSTPDPATASWYYTYYVTKDGYNYVGATITSEDLESEQYIQVTIYGYEDVIQNASKIKDTTKFFAAIQMQGGTLEVQEGGFYSYFGVDTTACVNASGGEIKIGEGYFSSRIPNATGIETVLVKEDDSKAFKDDYFNNFIWNKDDKTGSQASAGESYCILNHGTDTVVSINKGSFYSINNNIVCMSDGKLSIGGGSFKKQYIGDTPMASPVTALADKTAAIYMQNGSLDVTGKSTCTVNGDYSQGIYMQNGELKVSGAEYEINGKAVRGINMLNGVLSVDSSRYTINGEAANGINMANGKLTVSNSSYTVTGSNVYGIYSTVSGDDNFIVNNTSFTLNGGDAQVGIYAENGRVSLRADSSASISVSGNNSKGVQVNGGSVISENCNYTLNGENSYGIYAENGTVKVSATSSAIITMQGKSSKGIYVNGASVTSTNYNYKLQGATSTGIHSEGGTVSVSGGEITLDSNVSCYGIYAESSNASVEFSIDAINTAINVGADVTTEKSQGTYDASVGVYLSSVNPNNYINLVNTNISCYEIGVAVNGGQLYFKDNDSVHNSVTTNRASAIAVFGGNIVFDATTNYVITSNNTRDFSGSISRSSLEADGLWDANLYNITLPNGRYANTDGIYVSGGNFTANGSLSITHTGLANDLTLNKTYYNQQITSYAIRVLGGRVSLLPEGNGAVNITAMVGGGVYCGTSGDKSGELILGKSGAANNTVSVTASGNRNTYALYHGTSGQSSNGDGWKWEIPVSLTGGNAVELNGGNITLNCGTYTAQFGNGILAKIPSGTEGSIQVHNGLFYGYMKCGDTPQDSFEGGTGGYSGPASSYGIKVVGGADVQLYDGIYAGAAGGVMVTGITNYSAFSGDWAKLRIYGGVYGSESKDVYTGSTVATDGIMIFDKALVALGAYGSDDADKATAANLTITAKLCPFSANPIKSGSRSTSEVRVYYGEYNYGQSLVYNEGGNSANIIIYNSTHNDMFTSTDRDPTNSGANGSHSYDNNTAKQYFDPADYGNYQNEWQSN